MSTKRNKSRAEKSASKVQAAPFSTGTAAAAPSSVRNRDSEVKMITHVNARFLVILAIICVTVGTGTYFLHDYQVQRNSHFLKENAERIYKEGDSEKAIELYTQYIRLAPGDLDALARLGDLIDQAPPSALSIRRAYKVYSELLRESPNRADARQIRYRLVQLMMSLRDFSQAENQLARLLKLSSRATDAAPAEEGQINYGRAKLLYLLGQCEAAQEKNSESLASLLGAVIESPTHADYYKGPNDFGYQGAIDLAKSLGGRIPNRDRIEELLRAEPRGVKDIPEELLAQFPTESPSAEPQTEDATVKNRNATADGLAGDKTPPHAEETDARNQPGRDAAQIADAQPLVDYLLQQISAQVQPHFEGQIARAQYFLESGNSKLVDSELGKISDNDRNQPEVTLFVSHYVLSKAGRLAQEGKLDEALAAIARAEETARTGKQREPLDLRYDLLLANAFQQRFDYETEPDAKKSALQESRRILQSVIEGLPGTREAYQRLNNLKNREERDEKFLLAKVLEVEFRAQLIQTELTLMSSKLFEVDEVPPIATIDGHIEELEELTRYEGLLMFLKARRQYALLERKILRGPRTSGESIDKPLSWGTVAEALRGARLQVKNDPAYRRLIDLMLNRCYRELNEREARVALFREVLEHDSNWNRGRLELARALRDTRRIEDADRQYGILIQQGVVEAALERIRLQIQFQSALPEPRQQWHLVASGISELTKQLPGNPDLKLLEVEVKAQQGLYDDAAQILADALRLPGVGRDHLISLWQSRIFLQLAREDQTPSQRIQAATELWSAARAELANSVEIDLMELTIARVQSNEMLKTTADRYLKSLEKYGRTDRINVLESLIANVKYLHHDDSQEQDYALQQRDLQKLLWKQLAKLQPERIDCPLVLCRMALKAGDGVGFREELEQVRRIEGKDGPEGDFLDASWHIEQFSQAISTGKESLNHDDYEQALKQHYEPALKLLDQVEQQRPRWDRVPFAKFVLAGLLNDHEQQAELARKAIELGATDAAIIEFRLAYLNERHRRRDVIELGEQVLQRGRQSFTAEMKNQLTAAYFREGDFEQASFMLRETVKDGEKYQKELTEGMLKLAEYEQQEVYGGSSNSRLLDQLSSEAERHFLAAISAAPEQRDVWTRTVRFYLRTERVEDAKNIVQRAVQEMPPESPVERAVTLAACYRMLGESDLAKQQYQLAIQSAPEDLSVLQEVAAFAQYIGDTKLARQAWGKVLDLSRHSSPTLARRAQTHLSHLEVIETRTYVNAKDAIARLEASLPDAKGLSPEETVLRLQNLVTQFQILKRFPVYEFLQKQAVVLEQIEESEPLPLHDQLVQITLDRTLRRKDLAGQRLQALLKSNPESLMVRVYAAEHYLMLEDLGKLELAREQVEYLRRKLPNSFVLTALDSELAHADPSSAQNPADIIRDYLSRLDEAQNPQTVFEDSLARNSTGRAFSWLNNVKSLQTLSMQKRIVEAVRLLTEQEVGTARDLLMPILQQKDAQKFYASQCVRDCAALLDRFGLPSEAEQAYRRYLTVTDEVNAPVKLIALMGRQGKVEEAIQHGEKILNDKNAAQVVTNLEVVLRTQQVSSTQQQRIKEVLDRAIAAEPENVSLLHQLADYQDFIQDYDDAEGTYARILQIQPNYPVALNNLAWLMSMRKQSPARTQRAQRMIDQVIDVYGPTAELLDTRATVEMADGRYTEAIRDLEDSIAVAANAAKYFHLSRAQLAVGQKAEARESYRNAIELGFDLSKLHPLEQRAAKEFQGQLMVRN